MKRRKLTKLGICPHCKKPVSRRVSHTWRGDIPQYVYVASKDRYYHKHCWEELKKAMARRRKIKVESPSTPLGKFSISDEEY